MSPKKVVEQFAQDIYLILKNRFYDDIEGDDGQIFVQQILSWTNMFLDEIETAVDPDTKMPVDWWFSRSNGVTLGTAVEGAATISAPSSMLRLIADDQRYVQITQDGTPVSNWAVVNIADITNKTDRIVQDMCAMVGTTIVFSRPFKDTEKNGKIIGDIITNLPRLTLTNTAVLTQVKPQLLLKLGVAKNAVLPDIVQGGLTPTYSQRFDNLLAAAILRSKTTSMAHQNARQSFMDVKGIY